MSEYGLSSPRPYPPWATRAQRPLKARRPERYSPSAISNRRRNRQSIISPWAPDHVRARRSGPMGRPQPLPARLDTRPGAVPRHRVPQVLVHEPRPGRRPIPRVMLGVIFGVSHA